MVCWLCWRGLRGQRRAQGIPKSLMGCCGMVVRGESESMPTRGGRGKGRPAAANPTIQMTWALGGLSCSGNFGNGQLAQLPTGQRQLPIANCDLATGTCQWAIGSCQLAAVGSKLGSGQCSQGFMLPSPTQTNSTWQHPTAPDSTCQTALAADAPSWQLTA